MTTTEKLDLFKEHKSEYVKPKKPTLVETGRTLYIAVRGRGAPGDDDFHAKIAAVYGVAYTLKFDSKLAGKDYKVCTLEALWWGKRKGSDVTGLPKDQWNWQFMIRVPTFTKEKDLAAAIRTLIEKGKDAVVKNVKLETLDEGRCVQMLHVGPYEAVAEPIAAMRTYAADQGLKFHGDHHEIYLSDPRRVAPDRLKTILRRPVKPIRG